MLLSSANCSSLGSGAGDRGMSCKLLSRPIGKAMRSTKSLSLERGWTCWDILESRLLRAKSTREGMLTEEWFSILIISSLSAK